MSLECKYCNQLENKQDKPALKCVTCHRLVHLSCLKRQGTPGDFAGDVFFDFTCSECSPTKEECFERNRMSWVNALLLTFHHLNIQAFGISHHGFFHYKTHIASFIDRHWQQLFGRHKQKKNWMGTIAGTLSVYNGLIFRSGSIVLGETGWWKLQHNFSPAVASYIIVETTKDKPKGRPRNQLGLDKSLFYGKVKTMGYMEYIVVENEMPINNPEPAAKKRRLYSDNPLEMSSCSNNEQSSQILSSDTDPRSEPESMILDESYACLAAKNSYSDVEGLFSSYDFDLQTLPQSEHTDSCSERTLPCHGEDSDSRSSNNPTDTHSDENEDIKPPHPDVKPPDEPAPKTRKSEVIVRRESLFSSQPNSTDLPWEEKEIKKPKDLVELTEYEEIQLLKQVENLISKVWDAEKKAYLCRLRAKLALRRLKRHKHLPLFDLDKLVKQLGGYVTEDPKVAVNAERVLDRFQRTYLLESLSGAVARAGGAAGAGALLARGGGGPLRSAYSSAALKPYIRRDAASAPRWLRLTDELLRRTNRHIKDYQPPPRAPIDYSYVRPQHIAAVNNLCAQFFWPGIDLTEALQHPEFSCVVTYKKLVVGCAFLVPDVRPHEAYISFVLTRPEWRHAGIATFMLYHLLQTCTGKDVTLHVSPTNPAIFLYQKFGFKVEEFVQDFYEKYYDMDHKGCRHALFLRLVR